MPAAHFLFLCAQVPEHIYFGMGLGVGIVHMVAWPAKTSSQALTKHSCSSISKAWRRPQLANVDTGTFKKHIRYHSMWAAAVLHLQACRLPTWTDKYQHVDKQHHQKQEGTNITAVTSLLRTQFKTFPTKLTAAKSHHPTPQNIISKAEQQTGFN